ncbi:MAG TPA: hypothetical protein VL527_06300 [Dongiaceae bacterium]|jgi:hypothetical protein|nr:hypothetical protein [Dongiaceae bacterium]
MAAFTAKYSPSVSGKVYIVWLAIGALCIVAAGALFFRHDIAVAYHKQRMDAAWARISHGENASGISFEQHRAALTSLGYFERFMLPIRHLTPNSAAWKTLSHELAKADTGGYVSMRDDGANASPEVIIWARPGLRKKMEAIVARYDVQ